MQNTRVDLGAWPSSYYERPFTWDVQREILWQLVVGTGPLSKLIAWRSTFSHIDVITPDGKLRGAQDEAYGAPAAGYFDREPFYYKWSRRMVLALPVTRPQWDAYWEFSDKQLGKKYDNPGLVAFLTGHYSTNRNWRDDKVWFCSEEVAANIEAANIAHTYENCNHFDPGDCATFLCGAGARVVVDLHGAAANFWNYKQEM